MIRWRHLPWLRDFLETQPSFPRPFTEMLEVGNDVRLLASADLGGVSKPAAPELADSTSATPLGTLLADALDQLSAETAPTSLRAVEEFLTAGPKLLQDVAGLAATESEVVKEAFDRLNAILETLQGRVTLAEAARTVLIAAFLQPGTVRDALDEEEVALGVLMGREIERALRGSRAGG